jgi:hypothetical protein
MELEKVALVKPVDLAVGGALAVSDHAAEPSIGRKNLRHPRGDGT